MLKNQFTAAISTAIFSSLDQISGALWRSHGDGLISDVDAEDISNKLVARRALLKGKVTQHAKPDRIKPCRSPDRQKSLERRRRQALSGAIPASIAHCFTLGELAALSVVARAVQQAGRCIFPIDKIAALAGVSRSTVQNALRVAKRIGLIEVLERRRAGSRSDTNIVKIISPGWRAWLKLHRVGSEKKAPRLIIYKISYLKCGDTPEACSNMQNAREPRQHRTQKP